MGIAGSKGQASSSHAGGCSILGAGADSLGALGLVLAVLVTSRRQRRSA
jgi:MYXO-CTERM domain-containing protein